MPAPDEELLITPVPRGEIVRISWGAVVVGDIVRDKKDHLHAVVRLEDGRVWLLSTSLVEAVMPLPPAESMVDTYVPSEREAANLETNQGPAILRDIERREHTIARAPMWRMDPIANTPAALHNHLDMAHQLPVNDVVGRYNSGVEQLKGIDPEKKKEGSAKKRASLAELRQAHDEAHNDPNAWPMAIVHHHAKIGAP